MSDIVLDNQGAPATPSAGQILLMGDSSNKQFMQKNGAGLYLGDQSASITAQIAAHSADTYYQGMQLPSFSMQPGMQFEWLFPVTKGAAGVATPNYIIRIGAAGTVADTARLTLTGPAQTAAADTGFVRVLVTCRSVGVAGVITGMVYMQHNLAATGFANTPAGFSLVQATGAAFDNSALGGQFIGLSVNPGASGAWVVAQAFVRIWY